jgi:hypothetical protein
MFVDTIHHPVYISKYNVSENGFSLRLQVEPIQLGRNELVLPEDGDRIQSPKRCILKYKQDDI